MMPSPSSWAVRLAEDLAEVGRILGFESATEGNPVQGSDLRIDVVWKLRTSELKKSGLPVPDEIIVFAIEIQYSKSQASISHGLIKNQYANSPYHIIISYHALPYDYKDSLRATKPLGLIIYDGDAVNDLQLWIQYMLTRGRPQLIAQSKNIDILKQIIQQHPDSMTERLREGAKEEADLMFAYKRIKELFDSLSLVDLKYTKTIEESIKETIDLIQKLLEKYNIFTPIKIPANKILEGADIKGYVDSQKDARYAVRDGAQAEFVICKDKLSVIGGNYVLDVIISGRNFVATNTPYTDVGFTKSFTTAETKTFVVNIIEESIESFRKYEVRSNDRIELEQILKTIKDIRLIIDHSSA